jgi:DNA topoisomerase-6 subunit B
MPNDSGETVAEELAAQQRAISVAEFFERNRQMLGFGSKARALVTATKEAVDNAIDAAEEAGILPTVSVEIDETEDGYYRFTVTDNGPGVTKEQVPKVFGKLLYGSRFSSRVQSRGQQGIGISAAVLYGQLTTGKPAKITSKIQERDQAEYFEVAINTDENEPEIRDSNTVEWGNDSDHGTAITIYLEGNFRARSRLHEYIKHTAIVNPHVTVSLDEPKETLHFDRTVENLPEQPTEIKPHPHGVAFGTLRSLLAATDSHSLSGFLQSEFTRVGQTTANRITDAFLDRTEGRYCSWPVPAPEEDIQLIKNGGQATLPDTTNDTATVSLKKNVAANVNRKSTTVTDVFASTIAEELHTRTRVSWPVVRAVVDQVAETVSESHDTTLGNTVREKAAEAAWEVTTISRQPDLEGRIEEWTSDRKTTSDIEALASSFTDIITSETEGRDAFTEVGVRKMVSRATNASKSRADNSFGDTAQQTITSNFWESMERGVGDPPLLRVIADDRDLADALHKAMQSVEVMSPPSHCLSPIGKNELVEGVKKVYDAEFYTASQRDARSHSGDPFLVEAGIAYGGSLEESGSVDLLRFANRVPLVYKKGACSITTVVSGVRWNNYKLSDKGGGLPQGPVAIVVHVASTNVPFTSESKDAVASVSTIGDEIERAVRDVALEMKRYIKKQQTLQKRQRKQGTIAQILPEFSEKISAIAGKPQPSITQSLAQIMNNLFVAVGTTGGSGSDGQRKLTAANFDKQSSFSPNITVNVNEKPIIKDSPDALVTESDTGWVIQWSPSIAVAEEQVLELGIPPGTITSVGVEGVPDEKVTTAVPAGAEA